MNFRRIHQLFGTILVGSLLTSSVARAQPQCTSSTSGNPCFTSVGDFLDGVRSILPNDDLSFTGPATSGANGNFLAFTNSSHLAFSAPDKKSISPFGCTLSRGSRARLFNTPNDWYVALVGNTNDPLCGHSVSLVWEDSGKPTVLNPTTGIRLDSLEAPSTVHVINADVNQDGYDDLIVYDFDYIRVFTAADVNDSAKGLKQVVNIKHQGHIGKLAFGDFNGDGAIDLVIPVASADPRNPGYEVWNMDAFSICPGAGFTILSGSKDPDYPPFHCSTDWQVYQRGSGIVGPAAFGYTSPRSTEYYTVNQPRLAAGDFLGLHNGQAQLFADIEKVSDPKLDPYCRNLTNCTYSDYEIWRFDEALRPTQQSRVLINRGGTTYPEVTPPADLVRTTRLHGSGSGSDRDQIAIVVSEPPTRSYLQLITFSDQGWASFHGYANLDSETVVGLEAGRFDPPNDAAGPNYDKQIAVMTTSSAQGTKLTAYSFDQSWNLKSIGKTDMGPWIDYRGYGVFDPFEGMLHAADTQGRSALLGSPYKVTLEDHYQPTLVLGIPPMHIDYIRESNGTGPSVKNFTVLPSSTSKNSPAFNTQYTFASGSEARHEDSEQTDYSHSYQGGTESSIFFGSDELKKANAALTVTTAGGTAYKGSSVNRNAQYEKVQRTIDATSGFSDYLYFKASRLNLFVYPIIGKRCSDYTQNCPTAEKLQRNLQFSAPDEVEDLDLDGTTQQWYQPVQEPGNVFSYPWDLDQMKLINPGVVPVAGQKNSWTKTDTTMQSVKVNWGSGSSRAETTGEVNKWNVDFSLTVTGRASFGPWPFTKLVNVESANTFKYGKSESIESQNTDTVSLDASTGVQVNKPGFSDEVARQYFYYFTSYILGTKPAFASLTPVPTVAQSNGEPVDQQFFGPLVVSYAADPFHGAAQAPWWKQAYSKPDIGLSHPERWSWDKSTKSASFNYRQNSPTPATILSDPFYHMKGLFIGEASDDPKSSPNLSAASAGDVLRLRARIYNFSVVDMPPDSRVRVSFYGQIYNAATGSLAGDAFKIGEDTLSAIAGFNAPSNLGTLPNWKLATTLFDTTRYSGKLLVFWVVTWAENGQGNLLAEQEGHGLTGNPNSLDFRQITDVPVDEYSNNVGMFGVYTPFAVLPNKLGTGRKGEQYQHGDVRELRANDVLVEAAPLAKNSGRSQVTVRVHNTTEGYLTFEPVVLYDGDPDSGGKPFDVQRIPYLEADGTYILHTHLLAGTRGNHTIYVRVGWKDRAAPNLALTTLTVP